MQDDGLLKTACPKCDGHIAFPPVLTGQSIECPHCRERITLPAANVEPPQEISRLRIAPTHSASPAQSETASARVSAIESQHASLVFPKWMHTGGVVILTVTLTFIALYDMRYLGLLPVIVLAASIFICWLLGNQLMDREALPMVPAVAVHSGTIVWYLTFAVSSGHFILVVLNLSIEAALLIWLVTRPKLMPVVALTVLHCWGIGWTLSRQNSSEAAGVAHETVVAILTLIVLLRVAAILLLFLGLLQIRRCNLRLDPVT